MTEQTTYLDCQNLNCPMPIVKMAKAIKHMEIGDVLEVTATDPAFRPDVEAWARKTGHILESFHTENNLTVATVRKK